ncbi:MAG: hypothetical protein AAF205_10360, partial [Pseudomonadota bacterium]
GFGDTLLDWSVGVEVSKFGFTLAAKYIDTDASSAKEISSGARGSGFGTPEIADPTVVGSISYSF